MQQWRRSPGPTLAVLAAAVVGSVLAAHAWQAVITGSYLDVVTGVWLTLADDVAHGVFYRGLIGPDGYGGTRYFPLFFSSIGALVRLGAPPVAAGFAVSLASGVLLALGLRRFLLRLGLPEHLAAGLGALSLAPQFVQQTLLAIRSDVLAAALVVWGLAWTLPAFEHERPQRGALRAAALCFVLAAATKATTLYAPGAAVLALAWSGRACASARLGATVGIGVALMLALVSFVSDGRAIESWQASALAGSSLAEMARNLVPALVSEALKPSRAFTAVFSVAAAAWLALWRAPSAALPLVLLPAAFGATSVVLSSPGTIYTNQLVEVYAVCLLLVGWALARFPRWRTAGAAFLLVVALGSAASCLKPLWDRQLRERTWRLHGEREALVEALRSSPGPVLSESPEVLIMAGQRPLVMDPFSLRVVTRRRADVLADLASRLDGRVFTHVILTVDPESPRGRGWYANSNLGWPVVSRILANYEPAGVTAGLRLYAPRARAPEP